MVMFHQGWVRWGFGDDLGPPGSGPFTIDYRRATPHPRLTSASMIAMEVCDRIGPCTVMLSGGVDSQAAAFAFKASTVPVRFLMARYNGGLNDHDILTAEAFYRRYKIALDVIDVDILEFHESDLADWARLYDCASPHIVSHMKIASLVEGTVVFSGTVVTPDGKVGGLTYETFGLERYGSRSGRPLVGYFFTHDPHLHKSFSRLPAAHSAILREYERKVLLYRQAGFPVEPQETKLHGFERVKEHYDGSFVPPRSRLRYKDKPSNRPYDLLFRYPLEDELRKIKLSGANILY